MRYVWLHLVPNKGLSLIRDFGAVSLKTFSKFVAVVRVRGLYCLGGGVAVSINLSLCVE